MKFKICLKCKRRYLADLKYFSKRKDSKDGLNSWCKECCSEYTKEYNQKNFKKVAKRMKQYNQEHKKEHAEWMQRYRRTQNGRYATIKTSGQKRGIQVEFSLKEFIEWNNQQKRECIYCGISENLLELLKWGRRNSRNYLTIDRKNNNKGYVLDNICLACEVCNIAKNQYIAFKEMQIIGQSIKEIWGKRLNNSGDKNYR